MKRVLFLCSGNYYRSRFAEHLFNWLARQNDLDWQADSRGLDVDRWSSLRGISSCAVQGLTERGVPINGNHRNPISLALADLTNSDLVVAVKEAEHRPMMNAQFPRFVERVEYWHVHDLDCATPQEALPVLEDRVRMLLERLATPPRA